LLCVSDSTLSVKEISDFSPGKIKIFREMAVEY